MLGKYWGLLKKINTNQKLKEIQIKMQKIIRNEFEFDSIEVVNNHSIFAMEFSFKKNKKSSFHCHY
jgi:hypothetical protein